jgi:Uma2 family endonuclease
MDAARNSVSIEEWAELHASDRGELHDGHIIHKAAPTSEHSDAQINLATLLNTEFRLKRRSTGGWWIRTEISVGYSSRKFGFNHDLAGWRKDLHPQKPTGKWVQEKPNWVCGIISGNRANDLILKKQVLHANGVENYWTIDFQSEVLTVMRHAEAGYIIVTEVTKGNKARLEPFEELELDIATVFGDEP